MSAHSRKRTVLQIPAKRFQVEGILIPNSTRPTFCITIYARDIETMLLQPAVFHLGVSDLLIG